MEFLKYGLRTVNFLTYGNDIQFSVLKSVASLLVSGTSLYFPDKKLKYSTFSNLKQYFKVNHLTHKHIK